ncbi:hypothetical protein QE152_g19807 [Popillia japonica]|uniref:Retrotransposon gag domain-containing protein n=1 Tax=Popillia japonica TaxID=7064 RepID=A0AAW1KPV5_POPJA
MKIGYFLKRNFAIIYKQPNLIRKVKLHSVHSYGISSVRTVLKFTTEEKDKLESLVKRFEEHFKPRSNLAHELFIGGQQPNESVDQFITETINRTKNCELGTLEYSGVTDAGSGVTDDKIRQRLLENDELTLENAILLSKSIEAPQVQSEAIEGTEGDVNILNRSVMKGFSKNTKICKKCGYQRGFEACRAIKA